MGWFVHGCHLDLSFRVDNYGLSISGEGEQRYENSSVSLDTREINGLRARWTIRRASSGAELAGQLGLDVKDMRRYLDPALVKVTTKPLVVISNYREGYTIFFSIFVPDFPMC
jgi:hypothetical protein